MWLVLLCDLALASAGQPIEGGAEKDPKASEAAPLLREVASRVDLYGRFDGNLTFDRYGVDFANNGSRFGITAKQELTHGFELFGRGEWGLKLGESDSAYNVSLNPDTNFGVAEAIPAQTFQTRLGFVGMRFSDYGALSFGKQDGVYYDVSKWTDVYTVFGANGSSTFNAGTDGGQTGEGRANDAVQYRVTLGPVKLGVQAQFLDTRSPEVDGLGGSVVVDAGSGILVGTAYSHAFLDFGGVTIAGYDGEDAQAFTAGVRFKNETWTLASVNTWTHDHEVVTTGAATVMYDTLGSELYVARRFGIVMPYAGFDLAIPRNLDARLVDPRYGTRDLLAGARLHFDTRGESFAYVEGRTGQSHDALGNRAADAVVIGLRLQYSLRRGLGLEP